MIRRAAPAASRPRVLASLPRRLAGLFASGAILVVGSASLAGGSKDIVAKPKPKPAAPAPSGGLQHAPAIDLTHWINTPRLKPADLTGKVRVVEFWALGCVNCRNSVMAMREIHDRYAKRGVLVLGIHTPERPAERDSAAVAAAVEKGGIRYPVALDNDSKVFRAFQNRYWPTLYLVDRKGTIRASHIGELVVGTRAWKNICAAIDSVLTGPAAPRS